MTWSKCTTTISHSKIKLADAGSKRQAVFENPTKSAHERTQADGCLVVNALSADWVLTSGDSEMQAIVELKGKDVEHACVQILATAETLRAAGKLGKKVGGLIVCTQYPRNDTKIQRARFEFAKRFRGPVHAVTKSREFLLPMVVSFDGPG